jgi:hypothetical protein
VKRLFFCIAVGLVVVAAGALSAKAQTPTVSGGDDYSKNLLAINDYEHLPIQVLLKANPKLGLTEDAIRAQVELRLRQAHIQPLDARNRPEPTLRIIVTVVGDSFRCDLRFYRRAEWTLPNGKRFSGPVQAWALEKTGTPANNRNAILSNLDGSLDIFINAYLKANQGGNSQ